MSGADQRHGGLQGGGVLRRLLRDRRGNTLAIVGAALLPLAAMIGSGVDISRAYMAKTRLQSACDAAALAGRRVMTADTFTDNVRAEAVRFFNFNFAQNLYQTASFTPVVSRSGVGTVKVRAATTIPTTVMSLFGFTNIDLSVECDATQNFVNTDVMLVLDTTGSMNCTPEEAGTCGRSEEISTSRIVALREAVMALYDALAPAQTQLEAAGMRLRYGIVPYSTTVNVGALLNANHIVNSAQYQSRSPIYVQSEGSQTYNNISSSGTCSGYGQALATTNLTFPVTRRTTSYDSNRDRCTVTTTVFDRPVTGTFGFWYYEPRTLDTSVYKTFSNSLALPTRDVGTSTLATAWNGCIEERQTVSTITSGSGFTIPADAFDLNINMIPSSDASRWRPQWQQVQYFRGDSGGNITTARSRTGATYASVAGAASCPAAAKRLQAWTKPAMQAYVNALDPNGGTYHDVGMIWGARMISNAGVFADSPDTYNSMSVSRHIIFMTDGELAPSSYTYSAYGQEFMDQRVTGAANAPNQYERHLQRVRMICNAAKGLNASIWVIVFGSDQTLPPELVECASNPDQAALAVNRQQLIDRFTLIGRNIGALRLTQ